MPGGRFLLRRLALGLGALVALPMMSARPVEAVANSTADRMTGVSFLTENQPIAGASGEFQRIKSDGANTVSFDVWWVVPNQSSSSIAPAPSITDSDADLITAAREAHQAGLRVTLTPKFVVGSNTWRGDYNPPDPAMFFSSYQTMVDHYADLAQQTGMSLFYVGSEMIASDGYLDDWHQVVASARQHFSGPLSYEVDWREIGRFGFGDAVDLVSISAYFPLSNDASPTLAQLKTGWHSYQGADAFAAVAGQAQRWGKPIIFGEAGYQASTYAGQNPCCVASNLTNDVGLQGRAYQALLDTFVGQPWWAGITWWAWNNGDVRSPEGKPAEGLIGAPAVAFPSPAGAPGGSNPPAASRPSAVSNPSSVPSGPPGTVALPATTPATDGAPVAADGLPGGVGGSSLAAPPGSSGPDSQARDSVGLVRLRISRDPSAAGDLLGESIIAAFALMACLAASARLIARSRLARRRE